MTRSQTTIPFHNPTFHDDLPKLRDVEKRLANFLKTSREKAQRAEIEASCMTNDDRVYAYDLLDDADKQRIKGRAIWFLERQQAASGTVCVHQRGTGRVARTAVQSAGLGWVPWYQQKSLGPPRCKLSGGADDSH